MIEKAKQLLTPDTTERVLYTEGGFVVSVSNIILITLIILRIMEMLCVSLVAVIAAISNIIWPDAVFHAQQQMLPQGQKISAYIFVCGILSSVLGALGFITLLSYLLILLFWFNNFYCTWSFVIIITLHLIVIQTEVFRESIRFISCFVCIAVVIKFKLIIPYKYKDKSVNK